MRLSEQKLSNILYNGDILPEQAGYASSVLLKLQPFLKIDRRKNNGRRKYEAPGQLIPCKKKRGKLIPIIGIHPKFDRRSIFKP